MKLEDRTIELLKIGQKITTMGTQLQKLLDTARLDNFDILASRLAEVIYSDWGIPSVLCPDDLSVKMIKYMDGQAKLPDVVERLREVSEDLSPELEDEPTGQRISLAELERRGIKMP